MAKTYGMSAVVRAGFAVGVSTLAIGVATPALAQASANEAADNTGREIVVTAQFREQRLQDTPLSITAVDSQMLEARSQTDIAQVAAQAPNVSLTPMGGAYGSSISAFIRGIGQNDFNPAYEPGVGMYIDDVYYPTLTGANFDLLDLERVEVLRGPQGTLTGRNSIGGAIKLFSVKPNGETDGSVEATYGSRNRTDVRASAGFTIAEGLYGRIAGVFKHQRGYVDMVDYGCAKPGNVQGIGATQAAGHCTYDYLGEKGYAGVRGTLRYNPNETVDISIIGDYSHEDRTNAANVVVQARGDDPATTTTNESMQQYICGPFCTYANFSAAGGGQLPTAYKRPHNTTFDGWGVSGNATFKLSDSLSLTSITAYRSYTSTWGTDDDFTPDLGEVGLGWNDLSHNFFSQELRLNGAIGDLAEWTIGGYYSDQKTTYYTVQDIRYIFGNTPGFLFQFEGDDPVKAKSKAAFGTVILHPSEGLTLTGGLRYTDESKTYTFHRKGVDGTVLDTFPIPPFRLAPLNNQTASYAGNKLDWRISADYRVSPEVMLYGTASTGFKGGGVSARPFTAAQATKGTFGPETVTAFEIGAKTDLFDRKVRLNVSAFYNDYKDIQLPLSNCKGLDGDLGTAQPPCGARTNAGKAHFKGFEVEMNAEPVPGLLFDASLGYLDAKWVAGSISTTAAAGAVTETDPAAGPKWKWSIGAQYEADLGNAGSLTPRIDLNYLGKRFGGRTLGEYYFPSYTLANARVTWRNKDRDLSISLEVQNLFDKYYLSGRFDAVYAFTGIVYGDVGRPREWAVTVKKSF